MLFELINRNLLSEASFGGVKFSKLGFITLFIPVAVAYLMLRFMSTGRNLSVYTGVLYKITMRRYPHMYRADLDRVLAAVGGDTVTWMPVSYSRHLKGAEFLALLVELVTTSAGPLAFLIYAYCRLFLDRGLDDFGVWISLAGTLSLVLLATAFAFMGIRITKEFTAREQRELAVTLRRHRER